jgi:AhpC/TSA family
MKAGWRVIALLMLALPAHAGLKVGTLAPLFAAQATLAGHRFEFSLGDALKSGPVVLDFYPAAFTSGCPTKRMSLPRQASGSKRWVRPSSGYHTIQSRL